MREDHLFYPNEVGRSNLEMSRDDVFDRVARMAARYFRATIGLVAYQDETGTWRRSAYGTATYDVGIDDGLCRRVIAQDSATVILDAEIGRLGADQPGDNADRRLHFFAAAPIVVAERGRLGMVAVADHAGRPGVSPADREFLGDLAAMVAHELDARLAARSIEREIVARQRIERELEITNTRFRLAIANSPVVLCTEDRELRYTWIANPPAALPPGFFLGKTAEEIWPAGVARELSALKRKALEEATVVRGSVRLIIGQRQHYFDVTYEPLFDRGVVAGICGAAIDVTERHEAQAALRNALDGAQAAEAAKARFFAAASHDLRQPVQSLFLLIDVLSNGLKGHPAAHTAAAAYDALNALRGLLDSLLDISKLDAGIVSPQIGPVPLAPLCERLAHDARIEAARKGLRFKAMPTDAVVLSDPMLLERILRNLIENALRYTDRGGVLLGCRRRGDTVRIELVDTGHGIPAERIEDVFQEFVQLENDERDRRKGIGLGLAIVRRLTGLLGNRLDLQSRVGHGTRVSLELALSQAVPLPVQPRSCRRRLTGRAVVIEDETEVAQALALALEQAGLQVIVAASAEAAIAALGGAPPEVILADFRLRDGWTGPQAVAAVREHFGALIPAVLLTGDTSQESLRQAKVSGAPLLHKPVAVDRLLQVMGDALAAPTPT